MRYSHSNYTAAAVAAAAAVTAVAAAVTLAAAAAGFKRHLYTKEQTPTTTTEG
jgi:hypothetical protein